MGFPGGLDSKEFTRRQETWVQSLGREDPLEKGLWQPAQVFLPETPMDRGVLTFPSVSMSPRYMYVSCVFLFKDTLYYL